eukprot:6202272-Pleurochrysis_carterae.AAC.5
MLRIPVLHAGLQDERGSKRHKKQKKQKCGRVHLVKVPAMANGIHLYMDQIHILQQSVLSAHTPSSICRGDSAQYIIALLEYHDSDHAYSPYSRE